MTTVTSLFITAGLAAALVACATIDPDVGPLLAGACSETDSDPAHAVSFNHDIRTVISAPTGGCSCHLSQTGAGPGPATVITGLDLGSYQSLLQGGHNSGPNVIIANQPCESILYQKIGVAPPFGSRMPLGLAPLSDQTIQLIHDWIAEGALDN
jgi:hypothetical protein